MKHACHRRMFRILGVLALIAVPLGTQSAMAWPDGPPLAAPVWIDPEIDLGGGESMVTGVVTKGSNAYVVVSGKDANGEWNGQVRAYTATKALKWSSSLFPLDGGRTTQLAVAGSKLFVNGYYGEAGSGNEEVFLRAYDTAGKKGLAWEGTTAAPFGGLYPTGVKALGSKVVAFSNNGPIGQVRGSFAGFSASQKTGDPKWVADYGDVSNLSNQVNDIVIKGSDFAVAGTIRDSAGRNWFNIGIHSATDGQFQRSIGRSFDSSGALNEALAVAWSGAYVAAVGRVAQAGNIKAYFWGLNLGKNGMAEVWAEESWLGGDTTMNAVAIVKKNAYAAGYGMADTFTRWAFVKSFGLAPGTAKQPQGDLWNRYFYSNNMVTTGLVVGKKGVYMSGYGSAGITTDWIVSAYDMDGNDKWLQVFNPAGKDPNRAMGIAATSKAIIVVGQCRSEDDQLDGVVEALVP